MRRFLACFAAACLFSACLPGAVAAQGFVFQESEPEPEVSDPADAPEQAQAETPVPASESPEQDNDPLESFSFGGGTSGTGSASGADRAAWRAARAENSADAYGDYLKTFPEGAFAEDARRQLADLQAATDRRTALIAACDRMAGDPEDSALSDGATGIAVGEIDPDAALWTCARARAAAPDLARLSYNIGRISEAQDQPDAALRSYRSALRQSVEQDGAPHLAAVKALLRLSEPGTITSGGQTDRTLLQLIVEAESRTDALRTELTEARSEARSLREQLDAAAAREAELLERLEAAQIEAPAE
ncbi:lipopolysaccharide assembly protein LapB [Pseudoruegeria sp. HB172150]|uniref:tetratricopeptide repeat protein n=1 Tax=Pseudoruegeria sp. HB172150 TaxID=2721164 RepID=UPI0015563255|nr:hypothetical protein [Pseudoruegeria sp. HB172150]